MGAKCNSLTSPEAKKAVLRKQYTDLAPLLSTNLALQSRRILGLVEGVLSSYGVFDHDGQNGRIVSLKDYKRFVEANFTGDTADCLTKVFKELETAMTGKNAEKVRHVSSCILDYIRNPVQSAEKYMLALHRSFQDCSATSATMAIDQLSNQLSELEHVIGDAAGEYRTILETFRTKCSQGLTGASKIAQQLGVRAVSTEEGQRT